MRYVDLGVICAYLIGITWFGAHFKNSQKSLKDYFLGGRSTPWWAIAFSIVSAETSTLTVIGTPALAFYGDFGFLQVVFGYLLARIVISTLFLPHYFKGELFTAYELMQRRFGLRLRRLTAGTFLLLRALAEGVRVFAISIVVSIVLGMGEIPSIIVIVCLTLFYTFEGGMTAVIWTDVVQMVLYVAGAIVSLFVILNHIEGGLPYVLNAASEAGKLRVFDFGFDLSWAFFGKTYTFWAGVLGGCFLTIGILARNVKSVLEAGLGIASILYGALLGVFLLGLLNQRASERSAMIGMSAGIAVNLLLAINKYALWFPPVAWTWYVLIGTTLTIAVSLAASAILDRENPMQVNKLG